MGCAGAPESPAGRGWARARARRASRRARDLSRSSTTFRANDAYWTGKRAGARPAREAGRDPRARRTSVVLLVVGLHAVHRGEERPEGDDEREHRQRHERVPHLLRERQIARHLRERLRAVPPEPVPALGAPRPRGPRAARRLDDLPRPARPRRAVATARFRRFRHRARVTARVASRRVRARRAECQCARKRCPHEAGPGVFPPRAAVVRASRWVREPSSAPRGRARRDRISRAGLKGKALLIADQISEIKTGRGNPRVFTECSTLGGSNRFPSPSESLGHEQQHHATTRFSRLFPPLLLALFDGAIVGLLVRARHPLRRPGSPRRAPAAFDPASEARPAPRSSLGVRTSRALGGRRPARPAAGFRASAASASRPVAP